MKVEQITPLHTVRHIEKKYADDFAELTEDFAVRVDGTVYTAPKGMAFGPSIPRLGQSFVSIGDCFEGSAFHDLAYRCGFGSRKWADQVFRELTVQQSGAWIGSKAYYPLRLFGERTIDDDLVRHVIERGLTPGSPA